LESALEIVVAKTAHVLAVIVSFLVGEAFFMALIESLLFSYTRNMP
jgi:hypothetical protein